MKLKRRNGGFTLIEVIVSLVVAGILGTFLISFLGTGVTKSSVPVLWVKTQYELSEVMDKITADYRVAVSDEAFDINDFKDQIDADYTEYVTSTSFTDFSWNGANYEESGTDGNIMKVTLGKGTHAVMALFTQ
jgi:prepilin-type N-terminal cleavage/methylation domain-containing protein